jgi:hypothetical protein
MHCHARQARVVAASRRREGERVACMRTRQRDVPNPSGRVPIAESEEKQQGRGKWRSSRLALILNNHPCYGRPAGPPVICQRLSGFPASARHVRKQRRARRHHPTRDQIKAQCREPLATGRQTRATGNCDSVWRRAGECLNDGDDACAYVTGTGRAGA